MKKQKHTRTRAAKHTTPSTAPHLVDQKVIIRVDEQHIVRVWFDSLDGPAFAASTCHVVPQGEEFVCLFCPHETYDRHAMLAHFIEHLEKKPAIILPLALNPSLITAFRALPSPTNTTDDLQERLLQLLQKKESLTQIPPLLKRPDPHKSVEEVIALLSQKTPTQK